MSSINFRQKEKAFSSEMPYSDAITIDKNVSAPLFAASESDAVISEIKLIKKLAAGDSEAFEVFVEKFSSNVYALVLRICGDEQEAFDLTQDTFLAAFRGIGKFRGDAKLRTWLYRIAINESRNKFRWWKRRRRDQTISIETHLPGTEISVGETLESAAENPEKAAIRRQNEKRISEALRSVKQVFREAVILCDIEGLSYEEIAVALECNIGTVKSRVARGREELRKKLIL